MTNENENRPRSTARRLMGVGGLVVAVAMISATTAVWAAHTFNDVPDTHPFHGQIAAVSDACIAGGFPDDTYRPGDPVTRQAMAAFLARTGSTGGAAAQEETVRFGDSNALTSPSVPLVELTVDGPELENCTQWAYVSGKANIYTNSTHAATCHDTTQACNGALRLRHDGTQVDSSFVRLHTDRAGGTLFVEALVPITGGSTANFVLQAYGVRTKTNVPYATGGSLTVVMLPFGQDPGIPVASTRSTSEVELTDGLSDIAP